MNYIEKLVLPMIGESVEAPDVFTDDDEGMKPIRDSINFGIAEICAVTGSYTSTYLLLLTTSVRWYQMEWNREYFGWVLSAYDRERRLKHTGTTLSILKAQAPRWELDTGDPTQYFQVGRDVIGFNRIPDADGKVIELTCAAIPMPSSYSDDPVRLRENYARATATFAASEFFASRGDAARAKELYNKYIDLAGISKIRPSAPARTYIMGEPASGNLPE